MAWTPKTFQPEPSAPRGGYRPASFQPDAEREKQIGGGAAFLQGAGQMASGGFLDEIGGAVSQFFMPEGVKLGEEFERQQADPEAENVRREGVAQQEAQPNRYQQARGLVRDAEQDAETDQKGWTRVGQGVGLGLSILAPVPKVLASPTVQGGLYGLGSSDADLTEGEFGQAAFDAGVGAATGKVVGMAGNQVAKAARPVSKWVAGKLGEFAGKRAVKAAGAIQSDLTGKTPEQVAKLGNELLDDGLVSFGSNAAKTFERAGEQVSSAGRAVGAATKEADDMAGRFGQQFDMDPVLQRIRTEILEPLQQNPIAAADAGKIVEKIKILANADDVTFDLARKFKSSLDEGVNWKAESKLSQRLLKQLRSILDDETERQMGAVSPELRASFEAAKKQYGTGKAAQKFAKRAANRETGNRWLSLTDHLVGMGASSAVGGGIGYAADGSEGAILGALGGAMFNKFLRERGPAMAAVAARSLARVFERSDSAGKMARTLAENPGALGRFGPMILEAATKGPEEVIALHAALSADPAYRAALQ